jgi:hypothetical protein
MVLQHIIMLHNHQGHLSHSRPFPPLLYIREYKVKGNELSLAWQLNMHDYYLELICCYWGGQQPNTE